MLCTPWATEDDITCGPCLGLYDLTDLEPFLLMASETLYNFTEGAYPGICTDTVRPPSSCGCRGTLAWWPNWSGDAWLAGSRVGRACRCDHVDEVDLPGWPARTVTEVLINGAAIDPARYRIDNHRSLVFQPDFSAPGPRHWPIVQRGDRPSTDPFTWEVTYTFGTDPPPGGVVAATVLACEYAMSCIPELQAACRLPKNTVSLSKKGVGVAMADPAQLADRGETGIPEVDLWLRSDRWARQHPGASVFTGNRGRTRRKTSP